MSNQAAEVLYFQFFAWSAISWVPEVLSTRDAFVTSLGQADREGHCVKIRFRSS